MPAVNASGGVETTGPRPPKAWAQPWGRVNRETELVAQEPRLCLDGERVCGDSNSLTVRSQRYLIGWVCPEFPCYRALDADRASCLRFPMAHPIPATR
jgi:hypothetical protein